MSAPTPRPGLLSITPYVGGEARAVANPVLGRPIRLASNENPDGPSPRATAAYGAAAADLHRYPDGGSDELRHAIAHLTGHPAEQIVCGAGSDELLQLIAKCYAGPGDEVLYSAHGFLMYRLMALSVGATPVAVPERDLTADVDALLDHVTERTRIVFLANPNNPTGSMLSADAVERLHAGLPDHVLLVLDAAYAEYITRNDYESGASLVARASNVCMTRTFSKIYGLSALRLGWAFCPPHVADIVNRARGPFNVSAPAQAAGVAALQDIAYTDAAQRSNALVRDRTIERLTTLGYRVHPSVANFVLLEIEADASGDAAARAESVRLALKDQGILVRQMGAYGLPQCLRISIGTAAEMDVVVDAFAALGR